MDNKWGKIVSKLDFAFQPIVYIQSGELFGVEALLRNYKEAGGFYSIFNLFDEAYQQGVLYRIDLKLRYLALKKFSSISIENLKMFYNLDNRILYMPDYKVGNTEKILSKLGLKKENIVFELSERGTLQDPSAVTNLVKRYKQSNFKIAIDDFGTGIAGFQMLYYAESDFIKIDRFFIQNIQFDYKKRLFCSHIVKMAHIMGMRVIAEGIETKEEYYTCKEIGVDFLQGYFIQKPQLEISKIKRKYKKIEKLYEKDMREGNDVLDESFIEYIEPVKMSELSYKKIFEYFKKHKNRHFIPIIDENEKVVGALYEEDIRELCYSPYGMALACNVSMNEKLKERMSEAVCVSVDWNLEKIMEIYNVNRDKIRSGIFLAKKCKYYGFVNLNNLLHLSYERNLKIAADKNPLTKLPGNVSIEKCVKKVFNNKKEKYYLAYFDFNDFKPFNDTYGFRKGDRAILLFADILKKYVLSGAFVAHIGGDDFFVCFENEEYDKVFENVSFIVNKFKSEVKYLYSKEDRNRGYIVTKDRFDIERKFALLSASALILGIKGKIKKRVFDETVSELKNFSKKVSYPVFSCML
jgi:diguanylate cyclase (GGDEF)-like protein